MSLNNFCCKINTVEKKQNFMLFKVTLIYCLKCSGKNQNFHRFCLYLGAIFKTSINEFEMRHTIQHFLYLLRLVLRKNIAIIVILDVRFTLDPDPHKLEVPPSTLVTLSRPPLRRRSLLASARSEAYTLEPSIQAVTWFTCSRGPKLQSVRGAGIERTNSMQRCLKYRV
jgi:hypothetical protein